MQKKQADLKSNARPHLLTSIIFAAVLISQLTACGTSNTSSQSTPAPTAPATPTQPLANLTVYVTSASGMLHALKADTGQLRWQSHIPQIEGSMPVPIVIENGTIYAGNPRTINAFKASDGTLLWSSQGYSPRTGPLVADGKVFVDSYTSEYDGSVNISVAALKGTDGSQLWSQQIVTHGTSYIPTPGTFGQVVANGVFYVATYTQPGQFLLYAFNANDGTPLWHTSNAFTDGNSASLFAENGVLFVYVDRLFAYKISDGTLLWQSQGPSWPYDRGGNVFINQGTVYANTRGGLTAYNSTNGNQLWHVPANSPPNEFLELTLANGILYATQGNGASALDARTGKQLWTYKTKRQDWGNATYAGFLTPLTDSDTLYINNFMSGLAALDIRTGNLRWRAEVGGNGVGPSLVDGILFIGSGAGVIAAVRAKDGKILWSFSANDGMQYPLIVA